MTGTHDPAKIALHQGHSRAFHGDIGACAHRDSDISCGESGSIVDAVSGHADAASFATQFFDHCLLLVGKDVREYFVDPADAASHGFGRPSIVAGHHDDPDATLSKRGNGIGGGVLDRIRDHQQPRELCIDRDKHDTLALGANAVGLRVEAGGIHPQIGEHYFVTKGYGATGDGSAHTLAGVRLEIRHFLDHHATLICAVDDGGCERVLAALFKRSSEAKYFALLKSIDCDHLDQARLANRQGAGLVHYQRVDLLHQLEGFGVLDEHACRRAATGPDHDRHRRRQAERTGTGDDQDGDCVDQRVSETRLRAD